MTRGFTIPVLCYLGVTLGIPLLNGAGAHARFWRHAGIVLAVVTLVAALTWCISRACRSPETRSSKTARTMAS